MAKPVEKYKNNKYFKYVMAEADDPLYKEGLQMGRITVASKKKKKTKKNKKD
ncbi:hypothetical protein [Hydrogenimonas urashimensis]|uniref:hypothetical protein n=1 Tax=Hydrogenimonas urashimensis TaxID=2740515 RepID=UPI001915CF79|nr:hypothetical protein [Hydrogenimonas urashimensis]